MAYDTHELLMSTMLFYYDEKSELSRKAFDFFTIHFVETRRIIDEIVNTLQEFGRIDMFHYVHKKELITIAMVLNKQSVDSIVSTLYGGILRVFEKTHGKRSMEEMFSIREYIVTSVSNELTVVINV